MITLKVKLTHPRMKDALRAANFHLPVRRKFRREYLPMIRKAIWKHVPKDTTKALWDTKVAIKWPFSNITVTGPSYLGFTLPPGTRPHWIPGPAQTREQASAIQLGKGKPLAFQVGTQQVFYWSVYHPGYEGDPWLSRAIEELDLSIDLIEMIDWKYQVTQ